MESTYPKAEDTSHVIQPLELFESDTKSVDTCAHPACKSMELMRYIAEDNKSMVVVCKNRHVRIFTKYNFGTGEHLYGGGC